MTGKVSDVHNSHGLIFTLKLEKDGEGGDRVVDFLRSHLRRYIEGRWKNTATLYVNRIEIDDDSCTLVLVEQQKLPVQVKFKRIKEKAGLIIEVDAEKVPGG